MPWNSMLSTGQLATRKLGKGGRGEQPKADCSVTGAMDKATLQQSAPHPSQGPGWRKGRKSRRQGQRQQGERQSRVAPTVVRRDTDVAIAGPSRRNEANNGNGSSSGRSRRTSAHSKSNAWTKKRCTGQGCIFHNRFQALNDEDEPNLCPVEKQWTGRITVDSGAAESVWLEGPMPEIKTKPSVGSQTRVT